MSIVMSCDAPERTLPIRKMPIEPSKMACANTVTVYHLLAVVLDRNTIRLTLRPNISLNLPYSGWHAVLVNKYAVPTQETTSACLNTAPRTGRAVATLRHGGSDGLGAVNCLKDSFEHTSFDLAWNLKHSVLGQ